jgi:hypothetical protein
MANEEHIHDTKERETKSSEALEKIHAERKEVIDQKNHERVAEKSPENSQDVAREAERLAESSEKEQPLEKAERRNSPAERRKDGIISKKEAAANYKMTMKEVRKELPVVSRTFSKFIHNKAVERVSDAVGSTVARPNAILIGSLMAFVFTLGIFLVARYYGYPLSGSETIAAFALGWMVGLLVDYLRLEFTGGKS